MNKRIFLATPTTHQEEQKYIKEAFDTNWVAPLGANVDGFENELAAYIGCGHAAALSAGTAALHLAYRLSGISKGDIVLCSDLTFSATVNPISYENGTQVFIDSERDTWNIDPSALELAFKKYPNAKAVALVHLYGTPAKLDDILYLCNKYSVPLIEDAAESLGSTYNGKQTGTFGKYGIYSFNGNKIITTSGGGMLVSESAEDIQKARFLSTQARDRALHYQHSEIGFNYRMSNIVAGIGRGQLLHLDEHIAAKRRIYQTYQAAFADIDDISMNPYCDGMQPNFWLSCMLLRKGSGVSPLDIISALDKENIESRPIWKPMHMQPVFADKDFIFTEDTPVSEDIFARGLCLPSDIKMTDEEIQRVISLIKKFWE